MSHKQKGLENFNLKNFKQALFHFSLALEKNPNDKELKTYAILCDLANEREDEAMALYEYYNLSLAEHKENSEQELLEIINSLDSSLEKLNTLLEHQLLEAHLEEQNGISYDDFMQLVEKRGNFGRTFEDIMFSTKVIITRKEDFVHFLNLLVEHNFVDMALNYLESAIKIFPTDEAFRAIFKKMKKVITHEVKNTK